MANASIWQTQVYGKRKYMANASIWQTQVYGKRKYMANAVANIED